MKLKILLTLWGFLPLLGGCTAEQVADFKAGMERGAAFRERLLNGLSQTAGDAAQVAGAYARGYSQSYQSYEPPIQYIPPGPSGVMTYFPPIGEGNPRIIYYSPDSIHEYGF
jgi:hypothetical protein